MTPASVREPTKGFKWAAPSKSLRIDLAPLGWARTVTRNWNPTPGEGRVLSGTFEGVSTPCTLTILGVIMFLRFGQIVGQAVPCGPISRGLGGTLNQQRRGAFWGRLCAAARLGRSGPVPRCEPPALDPWKIPEGSIDVWWLGRGNGGLMLLLAHLPRSNPGWRSGPFGSCGWCPVRRAWAIPRRTSSGFRRLRAFPPPWIPKQFSRRIGNEIVMSYGLQTLCILPDGLTARLYKLTTPCFRPVSGRRQTRRGRVRPRSSNKTLPSRRGPALSGPQRRPRKNARDGALRKRGGPDGAGSSNGRRHQL